MPYWSRECRFVKKRFGNEIRNWEFKLWVYKALPCSRICRLLPHVQNLYTKPFTTSPAFSKSISTLRWTEYVTSRSAYSRDSLHCRTTTPQTFDSTLTLPRSTEVPSLLPHSTPTSSHPTLSIPRHTTNILQWSDSTVSLPKSCKQCVRQCIKS